MKERLNKITQLLFLLNGRDAVDPLPNFLNESKRGSIPEFTNILAGKWIRKMKRKSLF